VTTYHALLEDEAEFTAPEDLDAFLGTVYAYHRAGGLLPAALESLLDVAQMLFTAALLVFLVSFVDWATLHDVASLRDAVAYQGFALALALGLCFASRPRRPSFTLYGARFGAAVSRRRLPLSCCASPPTSSGSRSSLRVACSGNGDATAPDSGTQLAVVTPGSPRCATSSLVCCASTTRACGRWSGVWCWSA
jgi:hypothetical protein